MSRYILEVSYLGGDFHYYHHYPTKWWAKLYAWFWSDDEMTFRLVETIPSNGKDE